MSRSLSLLCVGLLTAVFATGCPDDDKTAAWSTVLDGDDLDRVVLSAWGSSADDVYGVGGGLGNGMGALVVHYDGSAWSEVDTGATDSLWWVFGLSRDDVYFVGENGLILRKQGANIETMSTPTTVTLYGIWGTSATDLWAVGGDPLAMPAESVLLHYDGTQWSDVAVPAGIDGALFKVWGASANAVFACGGNGAMLFYDGSQWVTQDSGSTAPLFTVHGSSATDVYAVGGPPSTVLHYDGSMWSTVDTGIPASVLNGVAVADTGDVVVVGMSGVKLRLTEGAWIDESFSPPPFDLHAVWADFGQTYAVGGNFFAPGTPQTVRVGIVGYYGTEPPPSSL